MIKKKKVDSFVVVEPEYPIDMQVVDKFVGEEIVVENGRQVRKAVIKEVDSRDNFKSFHVDDFSIENLQSIGAVAGLKPVQYTDGNVDNIIDTLNELNDILDQG